MCYLCWPGLGLFIVCEWKPDLYSSRRCSFLAKVVALMVMQGLALRACLGGSDRRYAFRVAQDTVVLSGQAIMIRLMLRRGINMVAMKSFGDWEDEFNCPIH